jgi:hypothetical protein
MLGRRFLLLVAVLMGLTALAASIAPRDPVVRGPQSERRPTPTPAPQAAEPAPAGTKTPTVERTISADAARPERVVVTEGDLVTLEVAGSQLDTVQLLGRIEPVAPHSPAVFQLLAERGRHPITLLGADRQIGTLAVREAS